MGVIETLERNLMVAEASAAHTYCRGMEAGLFGASADRRR
jgi:hypothetical protein